MKKFSKFLAMITVMLLGLTSTGVTAYAVTPTPTPPATPPIPGEDSKYEPKEGEIIEFKKYLISELGHFVPNVTFTYTIEGGDVIPASTPTPAVPEKWEFGGTEYEVHQEAIDAAHNAVVADSSDPTKWNYKGVTYDTAEEAYPVAEADIIHHDAVPAEDAHFEVFAGIEPEKVVISSAAFTDATPKYAAVQDGDSVKLKKDEVYQKQVVSIDFSAVKFEEPGIYRYKLTEDQVYDVPGLVFEESYDTQRGGGDNTTRRVRYIDVYVIDDETTGTDSPKLVIDKTTVMHEAETTVYTTDQMGSKDEKATVATAWELPAMPAEFATTYGSYIHNPYGTTEAAETDRAALSKKIHDDILAKNTAIGDATSGLTKAYNDAKAAYDQAEEEAGLPTLKQEMDAKLAALNTAKGQLDTLHEELKTLTDPTAIQNKRNEINAKKTAIGDTDPATGLTKAYNDAKAAYDAAKAPLEPLAAALKTAEDNLDKAKAELKALQDLFVMYEPGCVFEVAWKLSDKSDNYVNELVPEYDLQFHKKVTGNQGSKDKYFMFTVEIEGLDPYELVYVEGDWTKAPTQTGSTKYDKDTMKAANDLPTTQYWYYKGDKYPTVSPLYPTEQDAKVAAIGDITNNGDPEQDPPVEPTEWYFRGKTYATYNEAVVAAEACCYQTEAKEHLIADKDGKITHEFYLKHDEYVKLLDMKKGAEYTVTEDEEDYLKTSGTDKKAYTTSSPEIVAINKAIEALDPVEDAEKIAALEAEKTVMLAKEHQDPTTGTLGAETVVPGSEKWIFNGETYFTQSEAETAAKASVTGDDQAGYTFPGATVTYPTRAKAEEAAVGAIEYTVETLRGSNIFTGYTNTRDGILPTGIMIAATAGLAMLGIGAAGMFLFGKRKEEDEEEDEE